MLIYSLSYNFLYIRKYLLNPIKTRLRYAPAEEKVRENLSNSFTSFIALMPMTIKLERLRFAAKVLLYYKIA